MPKLKLYTESMNSSAIPSLRRYFKDEEVVQRPDNYLLIIKQSAVY